MGPVVLPYNIRNNENILKSSEGNRVIIKGDRLSQDRIGSDHYLFRRKVVSHTDNYARKGFNKRERPSSTARKMQVETGNNHQGSSYIEAVIAR